MELQNWEPKFEKHKHFSAIIAGSRRSGKSHFLKWLYLNHLKRNYQIVCVMSNSSATLDEYAEFISGKLFFNKYCAKTVNKLLKLNSTQPIGKSVNILLILDDCCDNRMTYDDTITQCFTRGRHSKLSVIVASQTINFGLNTTIRENLDYAFLFRAKSGNKKSYIINNFLTGLHDNNLNSKQEFLLMLKLLNKICINHGMIVIDYGKESNHFAEFVNKFKCPLIV
jgi:hypothetical protein